jgi:hypothetical protein
MGASPVYPFLFILLAAVYTVHPFSKVSPVPDRNRHQTDTKNVPGPNSIRAETSVTSVFVLPAPVNFVSATFLSPKLDLGRT